MRFRIYTLADISPTGARRGEGFAYHQEQNYMTMIQTIGIRTNPLNVIVSKNEDTMKFGSKYKGKQNIWCLEFEVDSQGGHSIEMLQEDFDLVPFNNNLEETVNFSKSIFLTKDRSLTNILFESDDK